MFRRFFAIGLLLLTSSLWAQNMATVSVVQPLSWEDALAAAARYHPDLIVARESVNQAKANVQIFQGAQLPEIDANASVGRTKVPRTTTNSSSVGVSAVYTLFDGGLKRSETNQAKAELNVARAGYRVTSALLRFNLRSAYIGLWQAQQNIAISQSILKLRQNSYDLINLHYQSGTEHLGSLKLAAAKLAQAKANVASSQRDLGSAQTALRQAIGTPVEKEIVVANDEPALPIIQKPTDMNALLDDLAKNHPSYLQSIASEKVAREAVKTAQADYWPSITISADAERASNDIPPKDNQGGVFINASYVLFNGFTREATIEKARAAYRASQASTRSVFNSVFANLKSAWNSLSDSIDNATVQKNFLDANTEREKIAQAQYGVGLLSYNEWTIIEDNLVSSEGASLNAKAAALKAEAAWLQAQGIILDE